jgi:hypothetical protein
MKRIIKVDTLLNGKGKKALYNLDMCNAKLEIITKLLKQVHQQLNENIIKSQSEKRRSSIKQLPNRIDFEQNNLSFYIDFTIRPGSSENITDVIGSIIYGVYRNICFTECIFPKSEKCKLCDRIERCDGMEEHPLIELNIKDSGIIESKDKLEDTWFIDDKNNLLNMHYCALEYIWPDALYWINEKIII